MPNPRRTFLATAAMGLFGSVLARSSAAATQWSDEEAANVALVRDFCASWATRDLKQILPRLSPGCIYRMSETTPAVTGHAGVTERLGSWMPSSDLGIEFRILETYASGPVVFNRRVDSFKSTNRPLTWEGVGVFFIQGGLISEWSDYTIKVTSRP